MLKARCAKCSWEVSAGPDFRFPPWCAHCGGDLKVGAVETAPPPRRPEMAGPNPAAPGAGARPTPTTPAPVLAQLERPPIPLRPSYFVARAPYRHYYRIYPVPEGLLFFTVPAVATNQKHRTNQAATLGNALGGDLGALVGQMIVEDLQQTSGGGMTLRELEEADLEGLRLLVRDSRRCFCARPGDLEEVRLEPPAWWQTTALFGRKCSGLLYFWHVKHGQFRLELPSVHDMRRAVSHMPPLFGDAVETEVVWDKSRQRFVTHP